MIRPWTPERNIANLARRANKLVGRTVWPRRSAGGANGVAFMAAEIVHDHYPNLFVRRAGGRVRFGRVEDERGLSSGCFHRIETGTVERVGGIRMSNWGSRSVVQGPRGMSAAGRPTRSSASGQAAAKARRTRLAISTTRAAILSSFGGVQNEADLVGARQDRLRRKLIGPPACLLRRLHATGCRR